MNIADLLREHATQRPDQVAVWFPTPGRGPTAWQPLTFRDIDAAADRYAAGLRAAGLAPRDRAMLMVRPGADFYALAFGMFRAGVVPVFIDPGMGMRGMLQCITRIAPRGLVAVPAVHAISTLWRAPFASVEVRVTAGTRGWWGGTTLAACAAVSTPPPPAGVDTDDDAVVVFTSGSTGPAKGVSLTHGCMVARVRAIQALFALAPGATITETLLVYTILEVCMGLTVVVPRMDLAKPATVDPAEVIAAVERFQPRYASASPVVWQRLVRHAEETGQRLDGLEMLLTTAAPIPVDLHERLARLVPATTELFTPYGATEAMPVSRIGSAEILAHTAHRTRAGEGTCVGRPADVTDVRILEVTDDPIPSWDPSRELPAGQVGEIVVRGAGVSATYRNAPEGDALAKIQDGDRVWHRMGDLGVLDADGRLWFCGRKSHRLQTARGTVPTVPVENVFDAHPAVARSALVGIGPPGRQEPVLCVELKPGHRLSHDLADAIRHQADSTRWEGLVTRVLHHPRFPTDARHNSKIRNEVLAAWAATR